MNKAKQSTYWQGLKAFSILLRDKDLPPIRRSNFPAILSDLGLAPVEWADFCKLLSRCRSLVGAQNKHAKDGRLYTRAPSSPEKLALLMCYGDCDAMTGEPLAIVDRSLDA